MIKPAIILGLLAGIAATPLLASDKPADPEARLSKMLEGATPGKPTTCMPNSTMFDSSNVEGVGIVYRRGRTFYVNRFEGGCPALGYHSIIVTRTPDTQLCRGEIARIIDNTSGTLQGSCTFGDFVPYVKAK